MKKKFPTSKPAEPDHSSAKLTFVAKFNDGVVTRMSTFCAAGEFDLERGIVLARAAYETKMDDDPPAIVAAKFVEPGYDDEVLIEYDAAQLHDAEQAYDAAAAS